MFREMCSGFTTFWILVLVILIVSLMDSSVSDKLKVNPPKRLEAYPASVHQVSDSVTNLAQKIARSIARPNSKTEIFSPISVAGALSLILLGAGGRTQRELLRVMGFHDSQLSIQQIHLTFERLFRDLATNDPSMEPLVPWRVNDKCHQLKEDNELDDLKPANTTTNTKDLEIHVENAIFANAETHIDSYFYRLAKALNKIELLKLDFKDNETLAVRTINNWINTVTHGRIADIVSHIHPETVMVIANTLYFRANWEEPFQPFANQPFFPNGLNAGSSFDVPMMTKRGCMPYYFWPEANIHVLGIPYKQNVTMYILMPMSSTRELVQALQAKINADTMNYLVTKMEMKFVTLLMPKMHVISSVSLKSVLEQLGANSLFQPDIAELDVLSAQLTVCFFGGETNLDIGSIIFDTEENTIRTLKQRITNCVSYEKAGIGRSTCLKNRECEWGTNKCFCCLSVNHEDDFRHRRRRRIFKSKPTTYVNEMLHKVELTISEVGTERGADSNTVIDEMSSQDRLIVNGPFLMIIREETTRLPLLYGAVYNPK